MKEKKPKKTSKPEDKRKRCKPDKPGDTNPHTIDREALPGPKYFGRPSKYSPKIHDQVAEWMARDGATVDETCKEFGISTSTFYAWLEKHESFRNAWDNSKDLVDKLVENALLKLVLGYTEHYEEENITYEGLAVSPTDSPEYTDIEGSFAKVERKIAKKKMVVKPDISAIKFWLVNRKNNKWKSDNIKINHAGPTGDEPISGKVNLTGLTMEELKHLEAITKKLN